MTLVQIAPETQSFIARDHQLLISGKWQGARSEAMIDVLNPADGRSISRIGEASFADVDSAIIAARAALETGGWSKMKPAERSRILHKIADLIDSHAEELAQLETLDNGKPINFARGDVSATSGAFRYFAGWADKIHGTTHTISMPGDHHVYTVKEPIGVVALIVPWNYPLVMAAMKLGPALAAGCAVVLKPAEDTSLSALRLGEIALEAGLPNGVLNIITGYGRTVGRALVDHPSIDKIAFTGSTATGKEIARAAANNLTGVTLELGGKSPNIVMRDADLEKVIPASAMGIFLNSGQVCTAPSRIYMHEDVKEEVLQGIAAIGKSIKLAPGLDEESMMGPLISESHFEKVRSYIKLGEEEGAKIVSGGQRFGSEGYFLEPTILDNTDNEMRVVKEEIFGPVLVAQTFRTEAEAIALANDTQFGLAASVWTQDLSTAHLMAGKIKAGIVCVNAAMGADWDVPFGGHKQSGIGRENGKDGLENYLNTKTVFTSL